MVASGVTSDHAKLALNFFYFLLPDEALTITAASQAMHGFKKALLTKDDEIITSEALLIRQLLKTLRKFREQPKMRNMIGSHHLAQSDWEGSNSKNMARWKEFLQKSDGQADPVLVLRYVLDVPVKEIAQAMKAPEGTVLYRIGRGLELLSTL